MISVIAALMLSGCITIEVPGLVSDLVKATKYAYKGARADKTEAAKAPATTSARPVIVHSYVGQYSQTDAEMKHLCVSEAAQKLGRIAGKELRYSVLSNEVVMLNNNAFANCELAVED